MKNFKKQIFTFYKGFKTTSSVEDDLKLIRKINNLILKYQNTNKEKYKQEIINIIKITSNVINFNDDFCEIIKNKIIEKENHCYFDNLVLEALT